MKKGFEEKEKKRQKPPKNICPKGKTPQAAKVQYHRRSEKGR